MKVVAAIQVRVGSTRLPRKAMAQILGKPMLWHLVERIRAAKVINDVIIATADNEENAPIREFAKTYGVSCFSGSELDLIDRLYCAARKFDADALVRITGDCPLADPAVIDQVVSAYVERPEELDYASNVMPPTFPDGLDTEVFPIKTLKRLWNEIEEPFAREWFPKYLWDNAKDFRITNVRSPIDLSELRWTVDYAEDLKFVREVFDRLYGDGKVFGMDSILKLLEKSPELAAINATHGRNDGLEVALAKASGSLVTKP